MRSRNNTTTHAKYHIQQGLQLHRVRTVFVSVRIKVIRTLSIHPADPSVVSSSFVSDVQVHLTPAGGENPRVPTGIAPASAVSDLKIPRELSCDERMGHHTRAAGSANIALAHSRLSSIGAATTMGQRRSAYRPLPKRSSRRGARGPSSHARLHASAEEVTAPEPVREGRVNGQTRTAAAIRESAREPPGSC